MPEGPEVRIIVEWLRKEIIGKTITDLDWNERSRYGKLEFKNKNIFKSRLPCIIDNIISKGKCIIFCLKKIRKEKIRKRKHYLTCNLAMHGKWIYENETHSKIWLDFSDNDTIYFNDTMNQGRIDYFDDIEELKPKLKKTGPDLLAYFIGSFDDELNKEYGREELIDLWIDNISKSRISEKNICDFLIEQHRFSGIGNYARAEILYKSRISPFRTLSSLSYKEKIRILHCSVKILYKSYKCKGLTIKTYKPPGAEKGCFETKVYRKEKDPKGNVINIGIAKSGQKIYWSPLQV